MGARPPSPDELIPLSQSLISPDLALAFDIRSPGQPPHHHHQSTPSQANSSAEFAADSSDLGGAGDEPARTLKRPRLVWTPQLHKRFVDAVAHLGIKNAVPKTIMQLMSVDGLTRENVASHLQKYRLYLKRMQGLSSGGSDPATDRLFASSPVPAHFLHPNRSDHFMPSFVPIATLQQQQQMAAAAAANPQLQPPQFHHRQIAAAHFGSPTNGQPYSPTTGGKFDASFLGRQTQQQQQMAAAAAANPQLQPPQFHHRQIAAAHFGSPTNGQPYSPTTGGKFDASFLGRQTQQQQQMAAAAAANPQLQPPQFHHRQIAAAHFGSPTNGQPYSPTTGGKFDASFLGRQTQQQQPLQRMSTPTLHSPVSNYVEDLESANAKTVLTLFPTRD
ncbi:hypothetical protein Bca52824_066904 [Brassica carinata]|uniref:HTH myb-type domain-containing protein n=1 Tax=Brassica carinata TaxID=52824 RepID=A0A8X7QS95_BRACI|nr:hypothetical protein Bca52824_066904 [Brassica carinata]